MSLYTALHNAREEIDDCVSVGVVDVSEKRLVAFYGSSEVERTVQLIGLAAGELLDGSNAAVQTLRRGARGNDVEVSSELIILATPMLHVVLRMPEDPGRALIVTCQDDTIVGMTLARARVEAEKVQAASRRFQPGDNNNYRNR